MREILFKAKRIDNGEWVEGSLVYKKSSVGNNTLCLIVGSAEWTNDMEFYRLCNTHWVDENTICQFTGLTDKKGNKIWENDIVIGNFEWYTGKYVIKWLNHESKFGFPCLSTINKSEYEVIGNIFDNLNC